MKLIIRMQRYIKKIGYTQGILLKLLILSTNNFESYSQVIKLGIMY